MTDKRYLANIITSTPTPPDGGFEYSSAPGVWSLEEAFDYIKAGNWPTAGVVPIDPFFNQTTLLLHGDGTNGGQNNTFLDSSANNFTITRNGNTTQGSFSPYGDRWSNFFLGGATENRLSTTGASIGTGNFTVELWLYPTAFIASLEAQTYDTGTNGFSLSLSSAGQLGIFDRVSASDLIAASSATAIPLNAWSHVAIVRSGTGTNQVALYVNGVSVATGTSAQNYTSTTVSIGARFAAFNSDWLGFSGYISDVRAVNGTAVYTSNFTPPTAPLTAISGTSLLTCQSNGFKDNSANNFAITPNGNVNVTTFSPYAPSDAYDPAVDGGSGYFDGTGDYLSLICDALQFGANDTLTIEFFVYKTADQSTTDSILAVNDTVGSNPRWSFFWQGAAKGFAVFNGTQSTYMTGPELSLNAWHHFAFVKEGSETRLYSNGVLAQTATSTVIAAGSTIGIGATGLGAENFPGYISDIRVVKGTALYTTNFTPPTAPLTAVSGTSLLCNFTNAAIFDSTAKNVLETVGNAQIDTAVVKYGTGSMEFDGTGDYLISPSSPDLTFGSGDFTVEFWWNGGSQPARYPCQIGTLDAFDATGAWRVTTYNDNANNFAFIDGTTTYSFAATNYNDDAWHHIAVTRSGTTVRGFVDGVQIGSSATVSTSFTQRRVIVGGQFRDNHFIQGYMDDLRITKGVARYTANFTPPTRAFPDQ